MNKKKFFSLLSAIVVLAVLAPVAVARADGPADRWTPTFLKSGNQPQADPEPTPTPVKIFLPVIFRVPPMPDPPQIWYPEEGQTVYYEVCSGSSSEEIQLSAKYSGNNLSFFIDSKWAGDPDQWGNIWWITWFPGCKAAGTKEWHTLLVRDDFGREAKSRFLVEWIPLECDEPPCPEPPW